MPIYKNKTQQFTTVAQNIIRDENLSLKDLGLLVSLLSLPDSWEFSERGLYAIFPNDGQNSIRTGLKNLEEFGYLKRERKRICGKLADVEWSIYDSPCLEKPNVEKPNVEKPSLENPPQYNTKESITNISITENKKERKKNGYDELLSSIEDDSLRELYYDYIKMRKLIKAPMTDRALEMLIHKVEGLETDVERQKKLLETAILNNWKSVYPLKGDEGNAESTSNSGEIHYGTVL